MTLKGKPLAISLLALAMAAAATGPAAALNQPHMQAAVTALEKAQAELTAATRDKGGHRARAIQLVQQALQEARMGMAAGEAYEAEHPRR
jgi:hypothetical protein